MEKRFKNGLVLGKFMPPHLGHLHLIDTAIENSDNVFVMICSLKNEPINGTLRYFWLRDMYDTNPNVKIIHCQDENPQTPEECSTVDEFYNRYWLPSVYSRINELDVVFTSEEYGDEFAKYLGVEHFLVDKDRVKYPVSGTKVRENPFENWHLIPDDVKWYFTRRIVLMGPESTGKTVLTKKLAEYYGVDYLDEYGRTYTTEVKPTSKIEKDDFYHIATKHNDMLLEKHSETKGKLLIVDTECMTTKIFGEKYIEGFEDTRLDEIIKFQYFDLYLLLDVDVPWVDDGTRDFPTGRKEHLDRIKKELKEKGVKFNIIRGNYEERFEKAKEVIKIAFNC